MKKGKTLLDISTGKDAQHSNPNYRSCDNPGLGKDIHNLKTFKAKSEELRVGGHPGLYNKTYAPTHKQKTHIKWNILLTTKL